MSKQKLFEYCQKYKVAPPQFVTTGQGIIFSSAVVVQCLDTVDDCQTFYSRETHQSKKKSENDAAEVALETINIAVAKTLPAMDAKVAAAATLTDFLKTLLKAVNNAHPGVFENHAVIPANYLLLFTGVHSALNRIDASYRKDSSGAYLYLLTALDSSVQNFLNVHKNELGTFVSKIADDPAIRAPWRSFRTQKLESVQSSIRFVLIPAASDMLPYEINADFQIEHSENDSENENETEDEISKKIGLKIVQALYIVQKALKIPGETTFTTPLFTPSVSDHLYGLSQLFNGDHIENNVVIKNDDTIIDRNLSDIRNHVRTDNGDDNATCKEMELSTGSGNLPPTSVHMKDSSPYVRSKSVWLPRLLIHHRRSAESEGNSGDVETGDSANVDNDYLTKVNTNISPKLELNRVASWLCSHPVFGDAIFSGISCDGFGHMSLQFLYSCLRVSLPSGLWIKDSASKFLFNMPCRFHHPAWTVFSQKLPATLLQEIIVRRCGVVTGYQKEIIPVLINADENDKNDTNNIGKDGQINENNFDERVYEDVPTNGWWKLGVLRTNNDSNDEINSVKNSSVKTLRPEKIKNKIILPVSVGLFSISGKEFITTSAVVRGSREAANNLQELALQILWEIQKCGEVWLNTVQSKLNFFFFKNLVSENDDKHYGEGKFFTENLKNENDLSSGSDLFYEINNDEITDEIFPMNVVLKELGEGKDENENEGEVENTLNSFMKDGGVVAFTLMITPIYKENNVKNKHIKNEFMSNREMNKEGKKKKIRYCDINVEASDINHNTNDIDNESDISAKKDSIKIQMNNDEIVRIEVSEDRGTSPKKPRLVSANIMPEKLNYKYTHDDKIGSATDKAVEEIEYVMDTVGERREGIENISTNARYANISTAGNEYNNKPITVSTQNQKKSTVFSESTSRVEVGCTVYTFSALKLMPIDLERMLLKLKVGEEIEVEYCCLQRGLNEFFKSNELNEKLNKNRNNGYFDIARDRVSDQEDNNAINKNESIVADEINEESFIRNQSEAVNAAEIVVMNEIEVYSFKILLMARKRVVNQALRKKIKPDLFYPSLSVQRRRLIAALLRASNVDTWMDVGCGECTMTDSVLKNIYVHKIDFGVEKNAKADTDTDADMSKDKKSGDDLSNCNSNKNTNEECISILGRDDFSRRGTKSSNDVSEKMINNFNVQNDKIKNTDNIFDVNSMNSTQDFSMQIPKLKVFIGLEINIDPLKIAKKNILQFLLESDPQNVPGIKCSLEKVFLYHGSVLSENVMRDMSIDEEERERDEKGRKKERGENDEAGPDINHFNDLDTANKSKSNKFIAITCIEVIEHLPSIKDAESALIKVLCEFKPDFAIFSTPNYEANRAIRAAVTGCTYTSKKTSSIERREEFGRQLGGRKGKGQDEERTGEGRGEGVTRVDDKQVKEIEKEEEEEEEFREADHKFEFTRKEFREWAAIGLNSCKGDYEVHFTEVGTLLPGMRCVDENENNELTENIKIAQNVGIRMYEKEYFEAISPFSKKFLETSGSSSSGGNISLIDKSIENNSNKAFDNPLLNSNQNGDGRSFINTSSFLERGKERGCGGASQFAIFRRIGGRPIKNEIEKSTRERPDESDDTSLFWKWQMEDKL